jgi:hypothetical protein
MVTDLIVYTFSRSKVERGDFSHFLSLHAPEKLPAGRRLRAMMGSMVLCVDGYDDDPRELHCIPEVRRFYAEFHEAWPHWLYFCTLETDTLRTMACCCMNSITALKVDDRPQVQVEFEPTELLHFLARDFGHMNVMCERGGVFEQLVEERTRAVFQYFGLPYDPSRLT